MAAERNIYQKNRISHWDRVSQQKYDPDRIGAFYHKLLQKYYRLMIPENLSVLEIGCGNGDLLSSLNPSCGVGIDFSNQMVRLAKKKYPDLYFLQADAHDLPLIRKFDVIILSDLVNDLWDVQQVFENVRRLCHPGTRLILNFYNNLWRLPLSCAKRADMGADVMEQNWFAPNDVENLLQLSGFEIISYRPRILFPLRIKYLSTLVNRYLINFPFFKWFALTNFVISRPVPVHGQPTSIEKPSVSIIVAARNEAGNIENIFKRLPHLGSETELILVEGHSTDNTYDKIKELIKKFPDINAKLFQQKGKGKGDAVRLGFERASGDILMILDADLTVPPEDLYRFTEALIKGRGEFINGVRLVYPMEDQAMRFFNMVGNKFFSLAFSWLLGQSIKDTLCGTKVMWKKDYMLLDKNRNYFGDFDPFGDFDLLFGAAKLNLKICEIPIRYRSRTYGDTNISRWRHGWLLLRMVIFAARRIKFI